MRIDARYYQTVRDINRVFHLEKRTPLTEAEMLSCLKDPAAGKFPSLETALEARKATLPKSWSVANVLAATCAGVAGILRADMRLLSLVPQEVSLIVDSDSVQPNKIHEPIEMAAFVVSYADGKDFQGNVRVFPPYDYYRGYTGLPHSCIPVSGYPPGCYDSSLFNLETRMFTPIGARLVDFVARTVEAR
ncbi:hypothetical protein HY214_02430 [Candidatus Roizmanbacteria bacterium]|nr:hypothetical protein [Candidatus Roizmanbacteria bacterium]